MLIPLFRQGIVLNSLDGYIRAACEVKSLRPGLLEFARMASKIEPSLLGRLLCLLEPLKRHLASRDANVKYLVLKCLDAIPPYLWAGNCGSLPEDGSNMGFTEDEVKLLMRNLDSPDTILRKMVRVFALKSIRC